jgi:hypothetical protein
MIAQAQAPPPQESAAVMEHGLKAATPRSAYGENTYQNDDDTGDYHDEPEQADEDQAADQDAEEDERAYGKQEDQRQEQDAFKAVPKQTVVIVVAKSQQQTQRTSFTASNTGVASNSQVRYVSAKGGRPVTPASSPFMLAINKTFALRINRKENDHIKKNRVYPQRTECLTVRRRGVRNRFKARMEHCVDDQRFWIRSPMSFRFEPAGSEKVYLTWMDPKGVKRCAHHDITGTRFYPCHNKGIKPTRYEILPTDYTGKFKIKQESRNRCFDGAHNNLWMNRCRGFDDQAWDIVTIAYDQEKQY